MILKSITLENFRSFKDAVSIGDLLDVNIFIGANNAGKSNILEALRYIQAMSQGNPLKKYDELVFDGRTDNNIHIALSFSPSANERKDFIKNLFQENPFIKVHEIIESGFFSDITIDLVLGSNGLLREEISIGNIVNGYLTIVKNLIEGNLWTSEETNLGDLCKKTKFENIRPNLIGGQRTPAPKSKILLVPGIDPMPIEYKLVLK